MKLKLLFCLLFSCIASSLLATTSLTAQNYRATGDGTKYAVDLSWLVSDYKYTQLWVQKEGSMEQMYRCEFNSATYTHSNMEKGVVYTFRLYSATAGGYDNAASKKGDLLKEVTLPVATFTAQNYRATGDGTKYAVDLSWSVSGYKYTQLWVQKEGSKEQMYRCEFNSATYTHSNMEMEFLHL